MRLLLHLSGFGVVDVLVVVDVDVVKVVELEEVLEELDVDLVEVVEDEDVDVEVLVVVVSHPLHVLSH